MSYYGQWETDRIIESYFPNGVDFCVEVGAYDGVTNSNAKYFQDNGANCIFIEPNPFVFKELEKNAPESLVYNVACGKSKSSSNLNIVRLHDNKESAVTSLELDQRLIDSHNDRNLIKEIVSVPVEVLTLDMILSRALFPANIDFISIDTEGTELDVLQGLSLDNYMIKLLVIENNFDDPEIGEYLSQFGYVRYQRYRVNDFYLRGDLV